MNHIFLQIAPMFTKSSTGLYQGVWEIQPLYEIIKCLYSLVSSIPMFEFIIPSIQGGGGGGGIARNLTTRSETSLAMIKSFLGCSLRTEK